MGGAPTEVDGAPSVAVLIDGDGVEIAATPGLPEVGNAPVEALFSGRASPTGMVAGGAPAMLAGADVGKPVDALEVVGSVGIAPPAVPDVG